MRPTYAVARAVAVMDIAAAIASEATPDDARRELRAHFFLHALALSAALHAAALVWLPDPRSAVIRAAMPLLATLRLLPAAKPADTAHTAAYASPRASRGLAQPRAAAGAVTALSAAPAPSATMLAITPADTAHATPTATVTPAAPAAAEAPPPGPQDTAAARAANEDLALESYGRNISALLSRQRPYPRLAALRGWEGEVRLRVRVARKGAIVAVQLLHSSGFEVLDRDAVQLVQQADPLPSPPPLLQDREFQIVVPIFYRLDRSA